MLDITIKTKAGPISFEWSGEPEEFQKLYEECEFMVRDHDPMDMAYAAIDTVIAKGWSPDEVQARGQAVWIVYGMLNKADSFDGRPRETADGLPITVFHIAAFQHIKFTVTRFSKGRFRIDMSGGPPLDS